MCELDRFGEQASPCEYLTAGCGVGGHCTAVDPYFITAEFPMESRMISTARDE